MSRLDICDYLSMRSAQGSSSQVSTQHDHWTTAADVLGWHRHSTDSHASPSPVTALTCAICTATALPYLHKCIRQRSAYRDACPAATPSPHAASALSEPPAGKRRRRQHSDNQPPHDPNDLLGPSGYGSAGFLTPGGALPYTIEFSNEKTAEVPADNVIVTEQLSPNLDWSTFQLGTIGFGSYVVNVPPGLTSYSTRVDATATLGVYVDIDASLNLSTGLLTVTFTSLDPTTLDTPSNPLVGFLPPDTNPPNGEGYINYTIQPKAGLATGATLNAQASIVFDTNAAIATPQITNTIDASPPTSTVAALPATTTTPSFTVSWSGSDGAGPGIASYNVYVSDDGGAFTLWQSDTTATSATYTGQVGHTYGFYSVATDNVGLVQPTPTSAQATTESSLLRPHRHLLPHRLHPRRPPHRS